VGAGVAPSALRAPGRSRRGGGGRRARRIIAGRGVNEHARRRDERRVQQHDPELERRVRERARGHGDCDERGGNHGQRVRDRSRRGGNRERQRGRGGRDEYRKRRRGHRRRRSLRVRARGRRQRSGGRRVLRDRDAAGAGAHRRDRPTDERHVQRRVGLRRRRAPARATAAAERASSVEVAAAPTRQ